MARFAGRQRVRTKNGFEVDFRLGENQELAHLFECNLAEARPHHAPMRFAAKMPRAEATQLVRDLLHAEACRGLRRATQKILVRSVQTNAERCASAVRTTAGMRQ